MPDSQASAVRPQEVSSGNPNIPPGKAPDVSVMLQGQDNGSPDVGANMARKLLGASFRASALIVEGLFSVEYSAGPNGVDLAVTVGAGRLSEGRPRPVALRAHGPDLESALAVALGRACLALGVAEWTGCNVMTACGAAMKRAAATGLLLVIVPAALLVAGGAL